MQNNKKATQVNSVEIPNYSEIIKKLRTGDFTLIEEMTGVPRNQVSVYLRRSPKSSKFQQLFEAASKVVSAREQLINQ